MLVFSMVLLILWIYVLTVLKRSKLNFWYFFVGSTGMFLTLMVYVQPLILRGMTQSITMVAGAIGYMTNRFSGYYENSMLFIPHKEGAISLLVDFECAGVIELFIFIALLFFYPVYSKVEKVSVGMFGFAYLFAANVLRIVSICAVISIYGKDSYFVAHSIVGRILYYAMTMVLYWFLFTKPQIARQRIGEVKYESS